MADVTLTYKGSTVGEMSASGTKTLQTAGKYCEGDIGVEYVKPAGGGDPYADADMSVDSNQVKMLLHITDPTIPLNVAYYQSVANGVEVDFGDGTILTSESVIKNYPFQFPYVTHTYADAGWYVCCLTAKQGTLTIVGVYSPGCGLLFAPPYTGNSPHYAAYATWYKLPIVKVAIGASIIVKNLANLPALSEIDYKPGGAVPTVTQARSLTKFTMNTEMTSLENTVFNECDVLREIIGLENTQITSIPGYAFASCRALVSISLPKNANSIGDRAFQNCLLLPEIAIPNSVRSIGANAFATNISLLLADFTEWTLPDLDACTFGANIFYAHNNNLQIRFATKTIAEHAGTLTNLTQYASSMTWEVDDT